MDVNKVMRIGQLAQNLLSHGMACDMQDASRQAEQMLGTGNDDSGIWQRDNGNGSVLLQIPQQQAIAMQNPAFDVDVIVRRFTSQVDTQNRLLSQLQQEVEQLRSELADLRSRVRFSNVNAGDNSPPVVLEKLQQEEQPHTAPQTPIQQEQKKSPRTGSYCPQDVAIEKFFYAGPK